jgi:hypothetical protein
LFGYDLAIVAAVALPPGFTLVDAHPGYQDMTEIMPAFVRPLGVTRLAAPGRKKSAKYKREITAKNQTNI